MTGRVDRDANEIDAHGGASNHYDGVRSDRSIDHTLSGENSAGHLFDYEGAGVNEEDASCALIVVGSIVGVLVVIVVQWFF